MRNLCTHGLLAGGDDLFDRIAVAIAQVVSAKNTTLAHFFDCGDVCTGEVVDVNIVAHTGAIDSGVVITKERQWIAGSGSGAQCIGY